MILLDLISYVIITHVTFVVILPQSPKVWKYLCMLLLLLQLMLYI